MLVFMAVLVALYLVGVGVSWVVVRRRERRLAGAEAH
jgi:Sec-independent protein secretion pathway component TatC